MDKKKRNEEDISVRGKRIGGQRGAFFTTGSGTAYEVPEDWFDVYTTRTFNISVADGSGKSVSTRPPA